MQLLKSLKILIDKRLKKLARSPNMIKRPKFFLKNLFPQNGPIDRQKAVFTAPSGFLAKSQRICWFSETVKKAHIFLRESTFLRKVSVKHGKQFWHYRRNFPDIKPTFCSSNVRRRYEKHKFPEKLKNVSMDVKNAVLTKPPKKFPHLVKNFQLKILKW